MLNRVVLIGRLTKKPELRYTQSNIASTSFTLAVNRNFTNQQGQREADFVNCVAWRKQAENMVNYLDKGSLIAVEGRIQTRNYENQQGQRVYVTEVVADSVQFLESRGQAQSRPQQDQSFPYNNSQQQPSYQRQQPQMQQQSTNVDNDPFADYGSSIDISDDDLPF
jgi:single-strand DNA-binding protein